MAKNIQGTVQPPVEETLDAIGDTHARDILAAVCQSPKPARDLADELDLSVPTVYRRIGILKEHELIRTRTKIANDGNHFQVFESAFDSVLISLNDDAYDVRIYRRDNLPDRFSDLWNDLGRTRDPT